MGNYLRYRVARQSAGIEYFSVQVLTVFVTINICAHFERVKQTELPPPLLPP